MKYLTLFFIFFTSISEAQVCDFETPRVHVTDGPVVQVTPVFDKVAPPPPPPPPPVGDRIIIWMHGLAGGATSWAVAAGAVNDMWEARSLTPEYSEYSLGTAVSVLHSNDLHARVTDAMALEETEDPTSNFIIAHSQGGLVSRALDQYYVEEKPDERTFGGIVTFGTSHGGAKIINSNQNGQLTAFADNACFALGIGLQLECDGDEESTDDYLIDCLPINPLTGLLNASENIVQTLDGVCNFIADKIVPKFIFNEYNANITNDYKIGSPVLAQLNQITTSGPKVAFYGEETEPVFFRTYYSLNNNPNNSPAFTADFDQTTVNAANANIAIYELKYNAYSNLEDYYESLTCSGVEWIFAPLTCAALELTNGNMADEYGEIADAFYTGWQWWLNANNQWKTLIGAREYIQTTSCHCVDYLPSGGIQFQTTFPSSSASQCESITSFDDCSFLTTYTVYEQKSDGIVPVSSAKAFPGAVSGVGTRMTGSNHQQMRNDSNLGMKLTGLFAGEQGEYFNIEQ